MTTFLKKFAMGKKRLYYLLVLSVLIAECQSRESISLVRKESNDQHRSLQESGSLFRRQFCVSEGNDSLKTESVFVLFAWIFQFLNQPNLYSNDACTEDVCLTFCSDLGRTHALVSGSCLCTASRIVTQEPTAAPISAVNTASPSISPRTIATANTASPTPAPVQRTASPTTSPVPPLRTASPTIAPTKANPLKTYAFDCGAPNTCTDSALRVLAGDVTCGDRIQFLMDNNGLSEKEACRQVAGTEHPKQCGVCMSQVFTCGMEDKCTDAVLDTSAAGPTCRERMSFLITNQGVTEREACNRVGGLEHTNECGACNPIDCDLPATCTEAVLNTDTGGVTCGDRINFLIGTNGLSEADACLQVAGKEFPSECAGCNVVDCNNPAQCTPDVLDANAEGISCRDRISFLITDSGFSEVDACRKVAVDEFPQVCGACAASP